MLFDRLAEQSLLTGCEPKSLIEVSSEHTPINLPSRKGSIGTNLDNLATTRQRPSTGGTPLGVCGSALTIGVRVARGLDFFCDVPFLYHVAHRKLTFNGLVGDVTQFLLPICVDWTFRPLNCCRQLNPPTPLNLWWTRQFFVNVSWHHCPPFNSLQLIPSTHAVNQCPPNVSPAALLRLVNACSANQDTVRSFLDEVRALSLDVARSRPTTTCDVHLGPSSTPCRPSLSAASSPQSPHQPVVGCQLVPCRRSRCENPLLSLLPFPLLPPLPTWIV